jgi:hypothetical protein
MKENMCQCQTNSGGNDPISLTIPVDLLKQLQEAAALAKTDLHSLILCYAQQGLTNSSAQLKRQQFLTHAKDVLAEHGIHDKTIEEIFGKFPY